MSPRTSAGFQGNAGALWRTVLMPIERWNVLPACLLSWLVWAIITALLRLE
jgi:hypothetical protein